MKGQIILGLLVLSALCVTVQSGYSTAWPEICRVMSLYRDCDNQSYRIVCGWYGNCSTACVGPGMTYIDSIGYCIGSTTDGEHQWPYAEDACTWYNGKLYPVKGEDEAGILESYFNTADPTDESKILVGALNIGEINVWVHTDLTLVDDSYWASGSAPTSNSNQCMYVRNDNDFKQYSEDCTNNYPFVCYAAPEQSS